MKKRKDLPELLNDSNIYVKLPLLYFSATTHKKHILVHILEQRIENFKSKPNVVTQFFSISSN